MLVILLQGHPIGEYKTIIYTSRSNLDDQVYAFQVGVIQVIWNIEVTLPLIYIALIFETPFLMLIQIALNLFIYQARESLAWSQQGF